MIAAISRERTQAGEGLENPRARPMGWGVMMSRCRDVPLASPAPAARVAAPRGPFPRLAGTISPSTRGASDDRAGLPADGPRLDGERGGGEGAAHGPSDPRAAPL